MNSLLDKSLQTLELPRVLEMLAAFAVSEEAKERCLALRPASEIGEAATRQKQTAAARAMLEQRGAPALSGIKPVAPALSRANLGGVLNTRELLDIAGTVRCARQLKAYAPEDTTALDGYFGLLQGNRHLEDKIAGAIISEEEISDNASPDLSAIRRKMKSLGTKIKQILDQMIHSAHYQKFLQDNLVSMRNDRYVVPVKAEHRGDVPGIVHDISASGGTVFIEPAGVVAANNELHELAMKEKYEIEKILAALTAEVAAISDILAADYELMSAIYHSRLVSDFVHQQHKLYALHGKLDPVAVAPRKKQ